MRTMPLMQLWMRVLSLVVEQPIFIFWMKFPPSKSTWKMQMRKVGPTLCHYSIRLQVQVLLQPSRHQGIVLAGLHELLVDCARNQAFLDWEVNEQIQKVKAESGKYANHPEALLLEVIHSAGYSGALANPLLASKGLLNRLNSIVLEDFVSVSLT